MDGTLADTYGECKGGMDISYRGIRAYHVVVVRKNLGIEKGEQLLFDDIRYCFYITTREDLGAAELVELPHRVMAALAWNLKAWFALMVRFRKRQRELLRMEFRRFQQAMVWIPAQIIRQGRRIIYRLLSYTPWLKGLLPGMAADQAAEVHLKSSIPREKTRRESLQQGATWSECLAQPDKSGFLHLGTNGAMTTAAGTQTRHDSKARLFQD